MAHRHSPRYPDPLDRVASIMRSEGFFATASPHHDNAQPNVEPQPQLRRFASVDCLRGVVMFIMLYVNDVAGVRGIPTWIKHYHPETANGMTLVDWVFGGFLFIVGLSIPLAFANRLARGDSILKLLLHVLT